MPLSEFQDSVLMNTVRLSVERLFLLRLPLWWPSNFDAGSKWWRMSPKPGERRAKPMSDAFDRDTLVPHFWKLHEALMPVCQKCHAVGSYRRRLNYLGDLDLIVQPFFDKRNTLFASGEDSETHSALDEVLAKLVTDRVLVRDEEVKKNGNWYKRFRLAALGIGVDLFIARADNFGYIQAIRTGPREFSTALVTGRHLGGLRPVDYRCKQGFVWRQVRGKDGLMLTQTVSVPTEEALFEMWGILPAEPDFVRWERPLLAPYRNLRIVDMIRFRMGLPSMPLIPLTSRATSQEGVYQ
jgi:hypothetical protein